jgi:hypothetical protein
MTPDEWQLLLYSFLLLYAVFQGYYGHPKKNPIWIFVAGFANVFLGLQIWGFTASAPLTILWFGASLLMFVEAIGAAMEISED